MAPREEPAFVPARCRGPHLKAIFLLFAAATILTLCHFASRFWDLQRLTHALPLRNPAGIPETLGMTSLGAELAAAPHHTSHAPATEDVDDYDEGLQIPLSILSKQYEELGKMEYGKQKHPPLKDDPPHFILDLPKKHIPTYTPPAKSKGPDKGEKRTHGKRLVVVGDVHGHLIALKHLLHKIGFNKDHGDHLILAGDVVTKGPDSRGVVQLAMDLGASAVRGNQDDTVIAAAREMRRYSADDPSRQGYPSDADATDDDDDDDHNGKANAETRKKHHARRVARSLSRAQLAWLGSQPIILRISQLPDATTPPWNAHHLVVVHGGLVPGTPLEKQDPWAVMNMRSFVYPTFGKKQVNYPPHPDAMPVPVSGREGRPWTQAWNRHENYLPPTAPHTLVIYGHDAKRGLQVSPEADISLPPDWDLETATRKKKETGLRYAFGLDSGCGHGRKLSALVIEAGPSGVEVEVVQVGCGDGGPGGDKGVEGGWVQLPQYEDGEEQVVEGGEREEGGENVGGKS